MKNKIKILDCTLRPKPGRFIIISFSLRTSPQLLEKNKEKIYQESTK